MIMSLLVNSEKYYNLPHYCHIMYDNNGTPPIYHSYRFPPTQGKKLHKGMGLPTNSRDSYGVYALEK